MKIVSLIILGAVSFIMPLFSFAQENYEIEIDDGLIDNSIVVANVAIYDAKINQIDRTVNVEFLLVNEDTYVQPQVRYSVALERIVQEDDAGSEYSLIVDEHVFEDEIDLDPGQEMNKKIKYEIPSSLYGDYRIVVRSRNKSGLPLAVAVAGNVTVDKSAKSAFLDPERCGLFIGEGSREYDLSSGVDVAPSEKLMLSCPISSDFEESISARLNTVVYDRTIYGDVVGTKQYEKIDVLPGNESYINQFLDVPEKPQAYEVVAVLMNADEEKISNEIRAHFVVQGSSASIQNIRLDKDQYYKGEKAIVSYDFSGRADSFFGSRTTLENQDVADSFEILFDVDITGSDGACASEKDLVPNEDFEWHINIQKNCIDPSVNVSLKDENGTELDSVNFSIKSDVQVTSVSGEEDENDLYKIISIVVGIALIILLIALVTAWRNRSGNSITSVLIVFLVSVFFSLLVADSVNALTLRPDSSWNQDVYFTINSSSRTMTTCGNITFSGEAYVPNCANTPQSKIKVTLNGQHFSDYYSACHTRWRMHTPDKDVCVTSIFKGWSEAKKGCLLWTDDRSRYLGQMGLMHGMTKSLCEKLTEDKKYMQWDGSCYMDLTGYKNLACFGGSKTTHYSTVSTDKINLNRDPGAHDLNFVAKFFRIEEDDKRNDGYSLDWWSSAGLSPASGTLSYSVTAFEPSATAWSACDTSTCDTTGAGVQTRTVTNADCTKTVERRPCACPPPCACDSVNNEKDFEYNVTVWPSASFCSSGTPVPLSPQFPGWGSSTTWTCGGTDCTGESKSCSASRKPAPPCECRSLEFSEDAPTSLMGCAPGQVVGAQNSNGQWRWTCQSDNLNCSQSSDLCSTECVQVDIKAPSNVYLSKDGNEIAVSVTINGYDNLDEDDPGTCEIRLNNGNPVTKVVQSNGSTDEVNFEYEGASGTISARCTLNVNCGGGVSYTEKVYTGTHQITSLCTEKSCNAQGSCQSTPKSGVTSVDDCTSTCSSNADCSTGRMIETRP